MSATGSIQFCAVITCGQRANATASENEVLEALEGKSIDLLSVPLECRAVARKSHGDNVEITMSVTAVFLQHL